MANIDKSPHTTKAYGDYFTGNLLVRQFDDLQVAEGAAVDDESHQRPHLVPALLAGGAGVDVQQPQGAVVLHLEDVRVAADEEARGPRQDAARDGGVVAAGVSADVLHQDLRAVHDEAEGLREAAPQVRPVDVAIDGAQGPEAGEAVGHLGGADVAGVPDFVARLEVPQVAVVPVAVGVREESYSCHKLQSDDGSRFYGGKVRHFPGQSAGPGRFCNTFVTRVSTLCNTGSRPLQPKS